MVRAVSPSSLQHSEDSSHWALEGGREGEREREGVREREREGVREREGERERGRK